MPHLSNGCHSLHIYAEDSHQEGVEKGDRSSKYTSGRIPIKVPSPTSSAASPTRSIFRCFRRAMAQVPSLRLSPNTVRRLRLLEKPRYKSSPFSHLLRRLASFALTALLLIAIWKTWEWGSQWAAHNSSTTIIVITPTHKRLERLADMIRFSQTLMHVRDLHWIVIEDANATVPAVERILQRSGVPYTYFYSTTRPGFPKKGWTHRNMGLEYVRKNYADYKRNAVLYFADDDNTYDLRVFDYIRRVKKIGVWAVGLVGNALVEAPHVEENGTITKWDVIYAPSRRFGTDMAGFAINLHLILSTNASFHSGCVKVSPESCFLSQFGVPRDKVEPFGHDREPKEILVWHTKTKSSGTRGGNHGYVVES